MSLEELIKKEPQIGLNEATIYPQTHQTSSQRFYQPDSKYFNSAEAFKLEKSFEKIQTLNQFLTTLHFPACPYTTAQHGFLQIRPKENLNNSDNLTIRFNYNYSCAVQMQDQFRQYDKYLELQRKVGVDLNKKRTASKNVQSKFKNTYGLIVGRVVKSCKEYFKAKQEYDANMIMEIENGRFKYIHERLSCQYINLESFQKYLNSYYNRDPELKKKRGKFIVQDYLMQEPTNGSILADLIIMFLDQENSDFQNYTCNDSKPKGQILKVLLNQQDLEKLRDKFKEMEIAVNELEWRCKKLHKKEEEM